MEHFVVPKVLKPKILVKNYIEEISLKNERTSSLLVPQVLCLCHCSFSNACAIQINLCTKYLLKKTVLEKLGFWQKELEIGKKVGCFIKALLGSLGLICFILREVQNELFFLLLLQMRYNSQLPSRMESKQTFCI